MKCEIVLQIGYIGHRHFYPTDAAYMILSNTGAQLRPLA